MDQQVNASIKISLTTVVGLLLIIAVSAIPAFHLGIASTLPQLESLRLDAEVAKLNLQEREGIIDRLGKKETKNRRTIDSCFVKLSVADDTIVSLQESLTAKKSIILNQTTSINKKDKEIAALRQHIAGLNNDLLCQDETISAQRKGLKLSIYRLNNAAILNAGLQDSVLLLLPDAIKTNQLRQNSIIFTFSTLLLLVILLIVAYGIWRGWFIKRPARRKLTSSTYVPERVDLSARKDSSKLRLSADLFKSHASTDKKIKNDQKFLT